MTEGKRIETIASELNIGIEDVKAHWACVMEKMQVNDLMELVRQIALMAQDL